MRILDMVGNLTLLLETTNVTKYQLNPKYNTNKDAYISINNELKPKLLEQVLFALDHTMLWKHL
jgi:hypothetical protein